MTRKFYDFEFLDKKPNDFGSNVRVKSHDIGFPAKNKITANVAFSNETYDFSSIYGSQTYGERKVKYVINVLGDTQIDVLTAHSIKTNIINWVMSSDHKVPLFDDKLPGYHFLGEVQGDNDYVDNVKTGELNITFTCYPFMIKDEAEGDDIWDTFDFNNGIAQCVDFDVDGIKEFILINNGIGEVDATVENGADMILIINGTQEQLAKGTNHIKLKNGVNTIKAMGSCHIHFEWHKEVI